jgi:drug/metabolite transporter (DMT)-like permease
MALFLAALSAVAYGTSDFFGGSASKSASPIVVTWASQFMGLLAVSVAAVLFGATAITGADLGWGAASGAAGAFGLVLLYSALSTGPMAVVAPITAVVAALLPVAVGFLNGERPSAVSIGGMAIALPAIVLVSLGHQGEEESAAVTPRLVMTSVGSGIGFGLFYVFFAKCNSAAGLVPAVAARVASVGLLSVLVAARGLRWTRGSNIGGLIVLVGVADVSANCLYLLAVQRGMLTLVAVVASLYPATTVVLARTVLREPIAKVQLVGLAMAAAAVALVAAGR